MRKILLGGAAAVLVVGLVAAQRHDDPYTVDFLMPSGEGAFVGATAMIGGGEAGRVSDVQVEQGKARITVTVDDEHAPLRAGTDAHIMWNSAVGRRTIEIQPGPNGNPILASGRLVESTNERVELDDVLAALDTPTRAKVQSLVGRLETTLKGREKDINDTITTAGPAVDALGEVLQGVGEDGPAIKALVTNLHDVASTLSKRHEELSGTVGNLGSVVASAARQQGQLKKALDEVPSTLDQGTNTFAKVPDAVDETVPLLEALRPATKQLPGVARNLRPVLADLRPAVAELRPTLASARTLMDYLPGLLDSAHGTLPEAETTVDEIDPAVAFLRPYTPEVIGFVSNWTSIFSGKNDTGHHARALLVEGTTSVTNLPITPPGIESKSEPAPGSLAGQPWTDANGDAIR
jgi:phospholipid/cholesterol/gamma-HCH transport system substrate-binding protein